MTESIIENVFTENSKFRIEEAGFVDGVLKIGDEVVSSNYIFLDTNCNLCDECIEPNCGRKFNVAILDENGEYTSSQIEEMRKKSIELAKERNRKIAENIEYNITDYENIE